MKNNKAYGICALTRTTGAFVKSHIIPLALTRLSRTGEKHIEAEIGQRIKHRANSWYDNALVTRAGEDVLADIDAKAIELLRKYKLVWSGWGRDEQLIAGSYLGEDEVGCRGVAIQDAEALQLFYLSIVWRAAASKRPEFRNINLPSSELEDIRCRVILKDPGRFQDYPVQLFQIGSTGVAHNRVPLLETKEVADSVASPKETIDYVRIYFDGLVSHVHLPRDICLSETYLKTCLRAGEDTIVFLHKFEDSRAHSDLKELITTVAREQYSPNVPRTVLSVAMNSAWPSTPHSFCCDDLEAKI